MINYDVPNDAEDYVHRIGRTARAKTEGMAITFVCPEDMYKLTKIERLIDRDFEKLSPPQHLSARPPYGTLVAAVPAVAVAPEDPQILAAAQGGQIWRFRDGKSRQKGPRPAGGTQVAKHKSQRPEGFQSAKNDSI